MGDASSLPSLRLPQPDSAVLRRQAALALRDAQLLLLYLEGEMTERDLYLRAARRIASGRELFSCNAIHGEYCRDDPVVDKYARVMKGKYEYLHTGDISDYCNEVVGAQLRTPRAWWAQARHFRVMLLCMMAACCEDVE